MLQLRVGARVRGALLHRHVVGGGGVRSVRRSRGHVGWLLLWLLQTVPEQQSDSENDSRQRHCQYNQPPRGVVHH